MLYMNFNGFQRWSWKNRREEKWSTEGRRMFREKYGAHATRDARFEKAARVAELMKLNS